MMVYTTYNRSTNMARALVFMMMIMTLEATTLIPLLDPTYVYPVWEAIGDYITYPSGWLLEEIAPNALMGLAEVALNAAGL